MPNCVSWYNPKGLPKAAVVNHERMWLASFMQAMSGVRADDIIYVYLPLYHSAGFLMGLTGAIDQGQCQLICITSLQYTYVGNQFSLALYPPVKLIGLHIICILKYLFCLFV